MLSIPKFIANLSSVNYLLAIMGVYAQTLSADWLLWVIYVLLAITSLIAMIAMIVIYACNVNSLFPFTHTRSEDLVLATTNTHSMQYRYKKVKEMN